MTRIRDEIFFYQLVLVGWDSAIMLKSGINI